MNHYFDFVGLKEQLINFEEWAILLSVVFLVLYWYHKK